MVDPVSLWPIRAVSKSVAGGNARPSRAEAQNAQQVRTGASLPKLVSLAADLAKSGPPVDYAKIAQLRQAIAQGDYAVDVDSIANAMIRFFRTSEPG